MHHPNFCCAGKIFFFPMLLSVLVYLVNVQRELNAGNVFLPPHPSVLIHLKMKATNPKKQNMQLREKGTEFIKYVGTDLISSISLPSGSVGQVFTLINELILIFKQRRCVLQFFQSIQCI